MAYDRMDNLDNTRQQAAFVNPFHTDVTPQPIKTPLEVQLGLTLLPARYVLRAYAKSANDGASPRPIHTLSGANWMREHIAHKGFLFEKALFDRIENRFKQFEPYAKQVFGTAKPELIDVIPKLRNFTVDGNAVGKKLIADIENIHRSWDAGDEAFNTIQHYFHDAKGKLTPISHRKIKSRMSDAVFELMYDSLLGVGSFAYTNRVQGNIHKDWMSMYRETVAYETGKNPADIQERDILDSGNQIVQSTMKNYQSKRRYRYTISALPFAKWLPPVRAMQWGEVAVGAWGFLWAFDIWGREPTMLETFRSFVNDKLNPLYGISDPIQSSDIINMYQQYAYRFAPERAFRSISINDEDANLTWAKSEKIFVRIAELMNESYNFKHTARLDPETNMPIQSADFTLPKFIYLLGHGLINIRRPEWSIAFVEIANSYGMDAVKEAQAAFRDGAKIEAVLEKYPVNLNPTNHINGISRLIDFPVFAQQATPDLILPEHPPKTPEASAKPATPTAKQPTESAAIEPSTKQPLPAQMPLHKDKSSSKLATQSTKTKQTPDHHIDAAAVQKTDLQRITQNTARTHHA